MAPAKRKDDATSTKFREDGSIKRRRLDPSEKLKRQPFSEGNAKTTAVTPASSKLPTISQLANEQPAFPRGGAGILTPLEKKQIRAQAERDVLIEQKRKKSKEFFDSHEDDELSSDAQDAPLSEVGERVKKSRSKKSSKKAKVKDQTDLTPRIEGLNYKRITSGSLILGQIAKTNLRDLAVSLPNNLTGYVPLTAISPQLTEKVESILSKEVEDSQEHESSDDEEDAINLSHYFHLGQWVRVAVTSTGEDASHVTGKAKKRVELSLDPNVTNPGLAWKDLAVNCTLQASVSSIEDHGVIVDLGLSDAEVQGFIPNRELPHGLELSHVKPGMIFLCLVSSFGGGGRIVKLSANIENSGTSNASHGLSTAPTVNTFLPGTLVEILLSDVTSTGLAGKVMGLLDVTSDIVQSGARSMNASPEKTNKPGTKIMGRLIYTFPLSDSKKLGFSVLNHVMRLESKPPGSDPDIADKSALHVSSIIDKAKVVRVDPGLGVYFKLGFDSLDGFAHISRLGDSKIATLSADSGLYKIGTEHRARVIEYNSVDNLFILSLQETVIQQPFLRVEDVNLGMVVKGKVEKLLTDESGLRGLIIHLSEGVTGFVPRIHLSDAQLQHPEKKFREGTQVSARVLSTDVVKRQVRLTLKKTLVNSDLTPWTDYSQIRDGASSLGTLVKVQTNGAVVQFYSSIRGFLPVAEMSEAYIKDASQHFRLGQVLNVNCLHVDAKREKLTVSCRDPVISRTTSYQALQDLNPGTIVSGTIFEKSEDDLLLRLADSDTIARLELDHISDGSLRKRQGALNKTRVGQQLSGLLVLEVQVKRRLVRLCNRASLLTALRDGSLLRSLQDVREGKKVTGFASNITSDGVFVSFVGGLTGLLSKNQIPTELLQMTDFGFTRLQTLSTTICSVDYKGPQPRFWLTLKAECVNTSKMDVSGEKTEVLIDAIDDSTTSIEQLNIGTVTKARITSVKDTQVNVELAKNVLGRIDVSEVFDQWGDIKDRKKPLRAFSPNQILPVRVLGAHDARNHRFLPISHRAGKTPVFELSAKPSCVKGNDPEVLTLDKVHVGSSWLAFVNNIAEDCLWVNITPNVRGRIRAIDVSDDLSLVADLERNFPVGSALKAQVVSVDVDKNHLDLTAKASGAFNQLKLKELSKGMILPGRITKTSERQVLVQLSDNIVGAINLIDLSDDYAKADPTVCRKNEIVRVCVVDVDMPNKKILLSLRPSKVLSSSLPIQDREIASAQQLHVNDVVRGFICNVADKGLFVTLGHGVTAFVRVSNLSDSYLKEWKEEFQRDQLVKGKIISLDAATGHVQMSLKESVLKSDYVAPTTFNDLKVGQVITGKVAKVEDFGVFIVIDDSANVRGLCHRSEITEQRVVDARKLFNEGDAVKAKVLKIDTETRRISFGLRASYFNDGIGEGEEDDVDGDEGEDLLPGGVELENGAESDDEESNESALENDEAEMEAAMSEDEEDVFGIQQHADARTGISNKPSQLAGLQVGGFDWQGVSAQASSNLPPTPPSDTEESLVKHKKKRKHIIQLDLTGDLDKNGPQSTDDYERLLLSQPDSSLLWLQYMAFHLELGEIDTARHLSQRALRTISPVGQSESEKVNIWIALLNLENAYGDDETIDTTFKSACEVNDPQEIHERLASIYIQSSKHDKADQLFQTMLKKFGASDPKIWINYATFLFDTLNEPDRGRSILSRALQTLPATAHVDITAKFAALEFRSASGLAERGRTIFEGLLDAFPKRVDLWNVLLDLEMRYGGGGAGAGAGAGAGGDGGAGEKMARVRRLFERIFDEGAAGRRIKNKPARFFFKRWLEFEEKEGDEKGVEGVKKRAVEWVSVKKA
jgi:rRNA biogenesis protein RRP5